MTYRNRDYKREDKTNYVHKSRMYSVWKRNRKKYPEEFSVYEVHHIDGDKQNNKVSNLALLLPEIHDEIHEIVYEFKNKWGFDWNSACLEAWKRYKHGMNEKDLREELEKIREERKIIEREREEKEKEIQEKREKEEEIMRLARFRMKEKEQKKREEQRRIKEEEKIRRKKTGNWLKISFFILFGLLIIFLIGTNQNNETPISNDSALNKSNVNVPIIPEPPPFEISTTKTEVIIKNNLDEDISLNITYRIYSKWFGKDSTESEVFEVKAKEEETFQVYFNDGCSHAPCSVSILEFERI